MIYIIIFIAALIAAMTGIGGGIIIRPILSTTDLPVLVVGFYASSAILSSTLYSICLSVVKKESIDLKLVFYLSSGAFIGGVIGNRILNLLLENFSANYVVAVQSILLILTLCFVLIATVFNFKIYKDFHSKVLMVLIGILIGTISIFIGIGGGILNVIVLDLFFKMKRQDLVVNSLLMILISQTASIIMMLANGILAEVHTQTLLYIISAALIGGIIGKELSIRVASSISRNLFIIVICLVIGLNVYIMINKLV